MPIDPEIEKVISLRRLGLSLPEPVSKTTVMRWVDKGVMRHRNGVRIFIQLEVIQMPWGRGTSKEAYYRFLKAINEKSPYLRRGKKE